MNTKAQLPGFSYGEYFGYVFITHVYLGNKLDMKIGDIILSVNGKTGFEEISTEIQGSSLRKYEITRPGHLGIIRFQSRKNDAPLVRMPIQRIGDEQIAHILIEAAIYFAVEVDKMEHPKSSIEIAAPTTKARWYRLLLDSIRSTIHSLVASNRTTKAVTP